MVIFYNRERLDLTKYGDEKVVKESVFIDRQFNPFIPSYADFDIWQTELEDESALFQYGQREFSDHFDFKLKDAIPSSWNDNLVENPKGKYKYGSIEIGWADEKEFVQRNSYSLLDMLGDIGGLSELLKTVGHIILSLSGFKSFKLSSFVLTRLFRSKQRPETEGTSFDGIEDIRFTI